MEASLLNVAAVLGVKLPKALLTSHFTALFSNRIAVTVTVIVSEIMYGVRMGTNGESAISSQWLGDPFAFCHHDGSCFFLFTTFMVR